MSFLRALFTTPPNLSIQFNPVPASPNTPPSVVNHISLAFRQQAYFLYSVVRDCSGRMASLTFQSLIPSTRPPLTRRCYRGLHGLTGNTRIKLCRHCTPGASVSSERRSNLPAWMAKQFTQPVIGKRKEHEDFAA